MSGRKIHTIRKHIYSGMRNGETFRPVTWSEKPYRSTVVDICEPITIVETYHFEKKGHQVKVSGKYINPQIIAENDGLSLQDWLDWFEYSCDGYVICWKPAGYHRAETPIAQVAQLEFSL